MDEFVLGEKIAEARDPVLVTHRHADRDAVGAAVGLADLLEAPARICLPAGATADAQPLLAGYETVEGRRRRVPAPWRQPSHSRTLASVLGRRSVSTTVNANGNSTEPTSRTTIPSRSG